MTEEGNLAELLKNKLFQLELDNPNISKEDLRIFNQQIKELKQEINLLAEDQNLTQDEKILKLYNISTVNNENNKVIEVNQQIATKQLKNITTQRDEVMDELNRIRSTKAKLEALCREMQNKNKLIEADSREMIQKEDEKARKIVEQFHNSVRELKDKIGGEQDFKDVEDKNRMYREQYEMVLEEHQMLQMDYEQEIENMASSVQATNDKLQEGIQVQLGSVLTDLARMKEENNFLMLANNELEKQIKEYSENYTNVSEAIKNSYAVLEKYKQERDQKKELVETMIEEKGKLVKKKEEFDAEAVLLYERGRQLMTKRDALKSICKEMQNELMNKNKNPAPADVNETHIKKAVSLAKAEVEKSKKEEESGTL